MTSAHNRRNAGLTRSQSELTHRAKITSYAGGRLTTLAFVRSDGTERSTQVGGGLRGKVRGLSPASRRRLMRRIAAVNRLAYSKPPAFLTLTYPLEFPTDPAVYKAHARAFLKRLWYHHGMRPVVWRLEFQKRGAPHFHMLVFDLPATEEMKRWVLSTWYEVCASGDPRHLRHGADLQRMESWKKVGVYLSKYLAKIDLTEDRDHVPVGRFWGVEQAHMLCVTPVSFTATFREGIRYRRLMQRYAGLRRPGGQQMRGCSVFLSVEGFFQIAEAVYPSRPSHRGRRPLPRPPSPTPP